MTARVDQTGLRILMTLDAVGGVWRYAIDLANSLKPTGIDWVFLGFGPAPSKAQREEAESVGAVHWSKAPLDWMANDDSALPAIAEEIHRLSQQETTDLLHLNLPSQAAWIPAGLPVVAVSHSCVPTWFAAVRGGPPPGPWSWHHDANRRGFDRADLVLAPSASHAAALMRTYGPIENLQVVHNASRRPRQTGRRDGTVLAAGRWWDEGKNGAVLDAAAKLGHHPITVIGSNSGPSGASMQFDHAHYLGSLAHDTAMKWMDKASIFVSPSVYEPFGLAVLEAANRNTALVLSDIATYRELWEGAAVFVDPEDPGAFADAIDRLLEDEAHAAVLAASAKSRASHYSAAAQRDAMHRHYHRTLASAGVLEWVG